jgi:hypothetical protein
MTMRVGRSRLIIPGRLRRAARSDNAERLLPVFIIQSFRE